MVPFDLTDITSSRHKADPYPFYARLRDQAPVCRVSIPPKRQEAWLVTRYKDVSDLLKDPRLAKDPSNALEPDELKRQFQPPAFLRLLTRNMLALDDPDHARLKKFVQQTYTRSCIEAMIGRTQAIAGNHHGLGGEITAIDGKANTPSNGDLRPPHRCLTVSGQASYRDERGPPCAFRTGSASLKPGQRDQSPSLRRRFR